MIELDSRGFFFSVSVVEGFSSEPICEQHHSFCLRHLQTFQHALGSSPSWYILWGLIVLADSAISTTAKKRCHPSLLSFYPLYASVFSSSSYQRLVSFGVGFGPLQSRRRLDSASQALEVLNLLFLCEEKRRRTSLFLTPLTCMLIYLIDLLRGEHPQTVSPSKRSVIASELRRLRSLSYQKALGAAAISGSLATRDYPKRDGVSNQDGESQ